MKIVTLIVFSILIISKVYSQEIPIEIAQRINSVNYVFEGEVINSEAYYANSGRYIYTSNTIEITKLLKGEIECGTIELITDGGSLNNETLEISHALTLSIGSIGVFLCNQTDKPLSSVDFYSESNSNKLEAAYEDQSFIRYWWDGFGIVGSDPTNTYDSLSLIYNSTELITGLTFVDCGKANLGPSNLVPTEIQGQDEKTIFNPNYSKSKMDSLNTALQIDYENYQRTNQDRFNDKIFYSIENKIITGTSTKYFEFDVMAKDDNGLGYLDLAGVRINYNTSVFGSNIIANNNLLLTRGSIISDVNCYDDPIPYETNSQTMTLRVNALNPTSCRSPILITKQSIIHVKMKIQDCNIPSNIILKDTSGILEPSIVLSYSAYTESPSSSARIYYEQIEHDQVSAVPACVTTITSFYPHEVAGGIKDTLTIRGFLFGDTRYRLYLNNADDGGNSNVLLDSVDYISWSDTLIKILVPSRDSSFTGSTTYTLNDPAGTGKFSIQTVDGSFVTSADTLKIRYSIVNSTDKNPYLLAPRNQFNSAFVFHCDTAVANFQNGAMKAVIDKALRDWTCLTGINWYLDSDTAYTNTGVLSDSLCIIKFKTLSATTAAHTKRWLAACSNDDVVIRELDIEINSDKIWFCDTTNALLPAGSLDFYHTILHELGHGHGLRHVIDTNAMMHYSLPVDRHTDLANDLSCDEGGNWEMDYSIDNIVSCSSASNIIQLSNPCSQLGVFENLTGELSYNVYPNPTANMLYIDFLALKNNLISVSIYSIVGNLVANSSYDVIEGENILNMDITDLSTGQYILQISSSDNKLNIVTKIIKNEN